MRHRLKTFINNGGRFINLSGNNMWWQVRYEDSGRTLVCYKDYKLDPATTRQQETDNTWDVPISDAEYSITGAHWRSGGYFGGPQDPFRYADGYGGYWVQRTSHWVFAGTGLADGDILGRASGSSGNVIGLENDGTTFNCATDGRTMLGPLANTGTPHNFTILGIAPVSLPSNDLGFVVMGLYTVPGGGAVFSANSTTWTYALADSQVAQVTRNVLDRFLAKDFPAEPISSSDTAYLFYDRFNCNNLDHLGVLASYTGPKWYEGVPSHNYVDSSGDPNKIRYTAACGIGEGSGLEISIDHQKLFQYQSELKPNWQATAVLYTRMYLNLSNLTMVEGDQFFLENQIYDDRQTRPVTQATLQVRWSNGKPSIRYEDALTGQGPSWVTVPVNQTFLLETSWDKPNNRLSLWVDGVGSNRTVDISARQPMNRVDLTVTGLDAGTQGSFCLDELTFHTARIGPLAP
jgi:hypothetical protein